MAHDLAVALCAVNSTQMSYSEAAIENVCAIPCYSVESAVSEILMLSKTVSRKFVPIIPLVLLTREATTRSR